MFIRTLSTTTGISMGRDLDELLSSRTLYHRLLLWVPVSPTPCSPDLRIGIRRITSPPPAESTQSSPPSHLHQPQSSPRTTPPAPAPLRNGGTSGSDTAGSPARALPQ